MTRNVGTVDRAVRIAVGLAVVGAGVVFRSWWGALGMLPLATGLVGWTPLYWPLGLSTVRGERR